MIGQSFKASGPLMALAVAAWVALFTPSCKSPTTNGGAEGEVKLNINGIVSQNGTAAAGVRVYLSWSASTSTITGVDGKYAFTDLGAFGLGRTSYLVTPSRIGTAFQPSSYEVVGSSKTDADFTAAPASYGTDLGSIAAPFTAGNQSGGTFNLADYFGNVILIDFASDGCDACQDRAQKAESIYQRYKSRGFTYILIVIQGSAPSWASANGLTFPVLDDNAQIIYNAFRKSSIPLPIILDRNMTIRYKTEGFFQSELEGVLNRLL